MLDKKKGVTFISIATDPASLGDEDRLLLRPDFRPMVAHRVCLELGDLPHSVEDALRLFKEMLLIGCEGSAVVYL